MRSVFEINVSKASSEVDILINGEKIHCYDYTRLNPLEAKKQLKSRFYQNFT